MALLTNPKGKRSKIMNFNLLLWTFYFYYYVNYFWDQSFLCKFTLPFHRSRFPVARENKRHFATPPLHGFSREMTSEKRAQKFHTDDVSLSKSWLCREGNLLQQIRSTAQIWIVSGHQHGIPAVSRSSDVIPWKTSCGVRCFLRLGWLHRQWTSSQGRVLTTDLRSLLRFPTFFATSSLSSSSRSFWRSLNLHPARSFR